MAKKAISTLVPWFGSNRTLAENVGRALAGCSWVGIPFAGGMCEVLHIAAPSIVVNDLHRHVINLARVVASDNLRPKLMERVKGNAFHPDELVRCQEAASEIEATWDEYGEPQPPCVGAAEFYFVLQWMGRSGKAGTDSEFKGGLPIRWNANGGDSNTRYRSAIAALGEFGKALQRCNFSTLDCFDFLLNCKDMPKHGIYCDPPFPEVGGEYRHKFDEAAHGRLSRVLAAYTQARVVCRFYDHPVIRALYREVDGWTWNHFDGRDQANQTKPEVLIVRNAK